MSATRHDDDTTKKAAIKLLLSGQIMLSEAAELTGEHRQTIAYWVREVDLAAARKAYLEVAWKSALRLSRGGA